MNQKQNDKALGDASKVIGEQAPIQQKIVDYEAHEEWQRLKKSPLLNEKRVITLSTGEEISLGLLNHQFLAKIYDLPEKEQNKWKSLKSVYQKLLGKVNGLHRQAYGTIVDADGKATKASRHFNVLDLKRAELIELFGRMFTVSEVLAVALKEWKMTTTKAALTDWRQEHIQEVGARIEEHKRNYSDIRLGYKRSRLEELSWLFQQRKTIYNMTKKSEDHRLLLDTLKAIKAEAEGDLIRIDAAIEMNLDGMMKEHLSEEVFKYFPLQEIILARVAAKAGIPVANLVNGIEKGYYYKMLHLDAEDADYEVAKDFPSTLTYDFDRISRMYKQEQEKKALEPKIKPVTTPAVQTKAKSIKDLLLEKLTSAQGDINVARNNQAGHFVDKENQEEEE